MWLILAQQRKDDGSGQASTETQGARLARPYFLTGVTTLLLKVYSFIFSAIDDPHA